MNILLIEILASLIATALLSLFIGWVIRGATAKKEVLAVQASWETKFSELKLKHRQDIEHLEDQVDRLDSESNQLAQRNDNISASLKENELSVHKARADAIELNRNQANTQERLQRIIAQKDEELKCFRKNKTKANNNNAQQAGAAKAEVNRSSATRTKANKKIATKTVYANTNIASTAGMATAADTGSTEEKIASLSEKRAAWEAERLRLMNSMGDEQETIAVDPADLPTEPLDKTVQINQEQALNLKKRRSRRREPNDVETDKTQMIESDQTLVLDDSNMNNKVSQRRTNKIRKPDNNDG